MGIIVETGALEAGANSFLDAGAFRVYCEDRLLTPTNLSNDAQVEAALLIAAEWLNNEERLDYRGYKGTSAQLLPYPRVGAAERRGMVIAENTVPWRMVTAQSMLTVKILNGESLQTALANGGALIASRTVGPLSVSYQASSKGGTSEKRLTDVMGILAPLLRRDPMEEAMPSLTQEDPDAVPFAASGYTNV